MKFLDLSRFQRPHVRQMTQEAKELNRKPLPGLALADPRNKQVPQPNKCDDIAEKAKDGGHAEQKAYKDLLARVNMNNLPQPMASSSRLLV